MCLHMSGNTETVRLVALLLVMYTLSGNYCVPLNITIKTVPLRLRRNSLHEYASPAFAQTAEKTREFAKAICKAHCLKECLEALELHAVKDPVVHTVLSSLQKMPDRIQAECRRLSSGFLYHDECERSCETGLPYADCSKECGSGEAPDGWACLTGCRKLDTVLKRRLGDCSKPITPANTRLYDLLPLTSSSTANLPTLDTPVIVTTRSNWLTADSHQEAAGVRRQDESGASGSQCTIDEDCPDPRICCQAQCAVPEYRRDLPNLVLAPQIMEMNKPRAFELAWNVVEVPEVDGKEDAELGDNLKEESIKPFVEPIIFLLQVRTFYGPEFDPMTADKWKTLVMTTVPGAKLSDPDVGWWYQYRIASVNRHGSRGFGDSASPPVRLTGQSPSPPSPPRNLVDGVWRFNADGSVHVRVEWKPPVTVSIPISEYRISWIPEPDFSSDQEDFTEKSTPFVQIVPFMQKHYLLQNVRANMTYQIQVQAICTWGSVILASEPVSHFITTPDHLNRKPYFQNAHKLLTGFDKDTFDSETGQKQVFQDVSEDGQYERLLYQCNCDNSHYKSESANGNRFHISSNFRHLRVPQSLDHNGFTIQFDNEPGTFDGEFLKTNLIINEFAESLQTHSQSKNHQYTSVESHTPRILKIQWKQLACIETGAQLSKSFIPLNPLVNDQINTIAPSVDNSRYVVLEPVPSQHFHPLPIFVDGGRLMRSGQVEISALQLNCHYSLFVAPDNDAIDKTVQGEKLTAEHAISVGCLCTPACFDDESMPWASHFSCSNKELNSLSPPTDIQHILISDKSLVYNVSWKLPPTLRQYRSPDDYRAPSNGGSVSKTSRPYYRVTWGLVMDHHLEIKTLLEMGDPFPRLDLSTAQTKVLRNGETSFILDGLQPDLVYVFKVQSIVMPAWVPQPGQPSKLVDDLISSKGPAAMQVSRDAFVYIQTPRMVDGYFQTSAATIKSPFFQLGLVICYLNLITSL